MVQQEPTQRGIRCLLCTNHVQQSGDVCPRCESEYIAMGKVLIEYAHHLDPLLAASPHNHIAAQMRFVPDIHFFLQLLDTPVLYKGKMIAYCLTSIDLFDDEKSLYQQVRWYGHTIPSAFMASTINPGGFPRDPFYFVPIANWEPVVSHTKVIPGNTDTTIGRTK